MSLGRSHHTLSIGESFQKPIFAPVMMGNRLLGALSDIPRKSDGGLMTPHATCDMRHARPHQKRHWRTVPIYGSLPNLTNLASGSVGVALENSGTYGYGLR